MTLYRATYQAPKGAKCRHMTFAAADDGEAARYAADWQIRDRLLVVKPLRALQVEPVQLALEG